MFFFRAVPSRIIQFDFFKLLSSLVLICINRENKRWVRFPFFPAIFNPVFSAIHSVLKTYLSDLKACLGFIHITIQEVFLPICLKKCC